MLPGDVRVSSSRHTACAICSVVTLGASGRIWLPFFCAIVMKHKIVAAVLFVALIDGSLAQTRLPVVLTDAGRRVHFEGFVFDGHNDLPWEMRTKAASSFDRRDIAKDQPAMHTD